jgi:hypothetical protein
MKIRRVGAKLYNADGQTARTNLTAAFRNFAKGPNDIYIYKLSFPTSQ